LFSKSTVFGASKTKIVTIFMGYNSIIHKCTRHIRTEPCTNFASIDLCFIGKRRYYWLFHE
jgi:putative heme iron utilization protein